MDEVARAHGFGSWAEMSRMIAEAPIDTPARLAAFERWKATDGTRTGLLSLMEAARKGDVS